MERSKRISNKEARKLVGWIERYFGPVYKSTRCDSNDKYLYDSVHYQFYKRNDKCRIKNYIHMAHWNKRCRGEVTIIIQKNLHRKEWKLTSLHDINEFKKVAIMIFC